MERFKMRKLKKAQVWFLDIAIAILFFTTALTLYFKYSVNLNSDSDKLEILAMDSKFIAEQLLSTGYPENWTELPLSNILSLGLLNQDQTLNESKLSNFINITEHNYSFVKKNFETSYDFFIEIKIRNLTISAGKNFTNPKYLIKLSRLLVYNNSIARLIIYTYSQY